MDRNTSTKQTGQQQANDQVNEAMRILIAALIEHYKKQAQR